ncbi:MAG: hypothetical protein KatS3mg039_1745 [Candidatus Kapaibacterium sp.]|nr:MAG: hypothetical protein KatS3mg039_1745 [Candidatus Kapabacteria bacterium]
MREWLAKALAAYVLHTPIPWGRGKLGKLAWWMYPYPILVKNEDGFSVKVKMNDPYDRWVNGRCPEPHFERHVFVSYLQPGMTVIIGAYSIGWLQKKVTVLPVPYLVPACTFPEGGDNFDQGDRKISRNATR